MAEIALAFRMNVLVYTAHPEKYTAEVEKMSKPENISLKFVGLDEVWSGSDIISLHCPMTKDTEKIICKENILQMKDGVIIVNVSRGGLVDEQDLAEALSSGKVAAAAADVVTAEPMKAENPLLTAPNMVITPHMAWASVEARIRLIDVVAGNVKSYLDGGTENRLV